MCLLNINDFYPTENKEFCDRETTILLVFGEILAFSHEIAVTTFKSAFP
jgi:hypothetical protein